MEYCKTKRNAIQMKISNEKETANVRDNILVYIPDGENVNSIQ